jgi:hypothetical protein
MNREFRGLSLPKPHQLALHNMRFPYNRESPYRADNLAHD